MARLTVVGTVTTAGTPLKGGILLADLDKIQSLREHTINPPGQERYVKQVDLVALQSALTAAGSTATAADVVAATVTVDDVSLTTIQTAAAGATLTADQLAEVQDILSYRFVETGNFLLSFDKGVLKTLVAEGMVKVFTEDGTALFTL